MSTNIEAVSEDESSRLELSQRIEKLQATVCYLIHINQELRQALQELTSPQSAGPSPEQSK